MYLQEVDPWLGWMWGKNLTQRNFRERDGVYGDNGKIEGIMLPDGATKMMDRSHTNSCGTCHNTPYRDGGWTPRQVVHHIVDSHANAYLRFKWVVAEDNPTIKTYDQDAWAKLPDMTLPLECSLATLDGLHQRWSSFLSMLPEEAWRRTGEHPDHGTMSLDDFLDDYAAHGLRHAKQITDLRDRKGW